MRIKSIIAAVCAAVSAVWAAASVANDTAAGPYDQPQPAACECVSYSCQLVPEVKQIKKTVYEVQEVPFCLKKLPPIWSLFCHHGCDDCEVCPDCQCPRFKKVLVKKEIVCKEICTSKCVPQKHVEYMPCQPCPCQASCK